MTIEEEVDAVIESAKNGDEKAREIVDGARIMPAIDGYTGLPNPNKPLNDLE